jgi:small subunit ribosomal protein S21
MQVQVKGNKLDRALRTLKRKLAEDGMFAKLAEKERYEKPSQRRRRKLKAAIVRERKRQAELIL